MAEENKTTTTTTPEVTAEEIKNRIEKARMEEKEKLYPQLERALNDAAEKAKKLDELAKAQQEYAETTKKLTEELQALKAGVKTDGQLDIEAMVANVAQSTAAELKKGYDEQISKLSVALEEQKRLAEQRDLALFKEEAIRKAGGESEIIPELVTGNSREEILAKVESAKAIRQRIRAEALKQIQETGGGTGQLTLNTNTPSAATTVTLPTSGSSTGVSSDEKLLLAAASMTPAEYAKNREAILSAVMRMQGTKPGGSVF